MDRKPSTIVLRARELRHKQTDAEIFLWRVLRSRRFDNYKFRRQQPIGPYVIDFFCADRKLAIELDGGGHAEGLQKSYDTERTRYLTACGIHVLRFWNNQLFQETDAVLQVIYEYLIDTENKPLTQPSPTKGRG